MSSRQQFDTQRETLYDVDLRSRRQLAIGLLGLSMILATDAVSLAQTPVQETTVAPPTSAVPIDLTGSGRGIGKIAYRGTRAKCGLSFANATTATIASSSPAASSRSFRSATRWC